MRVGKRFVELAVRVHLPLGEVSLADVQWWWQLWGRVKDDGAPPFLSRLRHEKNRCPHRRCAAALRAVPDPSRRRHLTSPWCEASNIRRF